MAITFFVGDHVAIDVDDPGYGYVVAEFHSDDPARWGKDHECTLRGRKMWQTLESLTKLACRGADESPFDDVDGLWPMNVGLARMMLPQFQAAVLYAAAGSDRAERLAEDVDEMPDDVLCARCNEGSIYSGHVMTSELCEQYGHQPFGYTGVTWQDAQELAASERRYAETRRRMADAVILPTETTG